MGPLCGVSELFARIFMWMGGDPMCIGTGLLGHPAKFFLRRGAVIANNFTEQFLGPTNRCKTSSSVTRLYQKCRSLSKASHTLQVQDLVSLLERYSFPRH